VVGGVGGLSATGAGTKSAPCNDIRMNSLLHVEQSLVQVRVNVFHVFNANR
jgi:hypothetical protein